MPSSSHSFNDIYFRLVSQRTEIPGAAKSPENALFLLVALLSDHLYTRKMLQMTFPPTGGPKSGHFYNFSTIPELSPFPTLSPMLESARINANLERALDAWVEAFNEVCPKTYMALYYYTRLRIVCPELEYLPKAVGYVLEVANGLTGSDLKVSDESVRLSWLVVDHIDSSHADMASQTAIWVPIILFHAALVVWQRSSSAASRQNGSSKILNPFISELEQVPWPCSKEMVKILRRLASGSNT